MLFASLNLSFRVVQFAVARAQFTEFPAHCFPGRHLTQRRIHDKVTKNLSAEIICGFTQCLDFLAGVQPGRSLLLAGLSAKGENGIALGPGRQKTVVHQDLFKGKVAKNFRGDERLNSNFVSDGV
jgi:hypothetical protein